MSGSGDCVQALIPAHVRRPIYVASYSSVHNNEGVQVCLFPNPQISLIIVNHLFEHMTPKVEVTALKGKIKDPRDEFKRLCKEMKLLRYAVEYIKTKVEKQRIKIRSSLIIIHIVT